MELRFHGGVVVIVCYRFCFYMPMLHHFVQVVVLCVFFFALSYFTKACFTFVCVIKFYHPEFFFNKNQAVTRGSIASLFLKQRLGA